VVLISSGVTCHFALESLGEERTRWQRYVGAPAMAFAAVILVVFLVLSAGPETRFEMGLATVGAILTAIACLLLLGLGPVARLATRPAFFLLWLITILLGAGFEAGQAFEFYTANIRFATNEFSSVFFTMTGFHGLHVAGGLVLLLLILGRAARGQFSARHHVGPAAVTLYWHFVDLVWVFLFGILYVAITAGTTTG
jgi:heme/copper-type cytochrome/quinol oxidase subunit 3